MSPGDSVSLPRRPSRADPVVPAGGDKPGPSPPAAPLGPALGLPGRYVRDPAGVYRFVIEAYDCQDVAISLCHKSTHTYVHTFVDPFNMDSRVDAESARRRQHREGDIERPSS